MMKKLEKFTFDRSLWSRDFMLEFGSERRCAVGQYCKAAGHEIPSTRYHAGAVVEFKRDVLGIDNGDAPCQTFADILEANHRCDDEGLIKAFAAVGVEVELVGEWPTNTYELQLAAVEAADAAEFGS